MSYRKKLLTDVKDSRSGGVLAGLLRQIINDMGLVDKLPGILSRYADRVKYNSDKLINLSTVKKDIFSDNITFKSFIYIIKEVLLPVSFKITISIKWRNGKTTHHSREITNNPNE